VLQDYIRAVTDAEARVERLLRQIEDLAQNWLLAPVVEALQARRGVAFIVAVTFVAEVGDFSRFASPRQLMAYLGLVPSEHSPPPHS
jgi:transposase